MPAHNKRDFGNLWGIFLLILATLVIFYDLGRAKLWGWDEAIHAEVAREIIQERTGWLNTHYNFTSWFQKPPLFIWFIAFSYKIFGVSEFATRLPSALFGVGVVFLLWLFAKSLFNREIAFFSGLFLLGFDNFLELSRMGMTDTALSFFILLVIYLFWKGRTKENYLFWLGIIFGIGFFIKGVAIFITLPIILIFIVMGEERKKIFSPSLSKGLGIGIFLIFLWHFYQYLINRNDFISYYFFYNIGERITTYIDKYSTSPLHYLEILISTNRPWGIFSLVATLFLLIFSFREKDKEKKKAIILILCAGISILVFFSLAKTKRFWYILPSYPFLSLGMAVILERLINRFGDKKNQVRKILLILIIFIVLFVFSKYATLTYDEDLKIISQEASRQIPKGDTLLIYDIFESPVVLFYSKRKIEEISSHQVVSPKNWKGKFCLLPKNKRMWSFIKKKVNAELLIVGENSRYVILKNCLPEK